MPTPAPAGVGFLVAFYAFPLVGVVIATRRPDHAIGWLFLAAGDRVGLSDFASSYADYALYANPGDLPAGNWVGWSFQKRAARFTTGRFCMCRV